MLSAGLVVITGWFSGNNFVILPNKMVQLSGLGSSTQLSDHVSKILTIERLLRLSKREIAHLMVQTEIMSFTF